MTGQSVIVDGVGPQSEGAALVSICCCSGGHFRIAAHGAIGDRRRRGDQAAANTSANPVSRVIDLAERRPLTKRFAINPEGLATSTVTFTIESNVQ